PVLEPMERDPFVRRVLIDDHELAAALAEDVRRRELPQYGEVAVPIDGKQIAILVQRRFVDDRDRSFARVAQGEVPCNGWRRTGPWRVQGPPLEQGCRIAHGRRRV